MIVPHVDCASEIRKRFVIDTYAIGKLCRRMLDAHSAGRSGITARLTRRDGRIEFPTTSTGDEIRERDVLRAAARLGLWPVVFGIKYPVTSLCAFLGLALLTPLTKIGRRESVESRRAVLTSPAPFHRRAVRGNFRR